MILLRFGAVSLLLGAALARALPGSNDDSAVLIKSPDWRRDAIPLPESAKDNKTLISNPDPKVDLQVSGSLSKNKTELVRPHVGLSTNGTKTKQPIGAKPFKVLAAGTPTATFDCTHYPAACANMCFNRYCRPGRVGSAPYLLHRVPKKCGQANRKRGGYFPPQNSRSPCQANPPTAGTGRFWDAQLPGWTSMDEMPMASWWEGGLHLNGGNWIGPGYRCIDPTENTRFGFRIWGKQIKKQRIGAATGVQATNQFDIEFVNTQNVGIAGTLQDWCSPTTTCVNDGNQFEAIWNGNFWGNNGQWREMDYVRI